METLENQTNPARPARAQKSIAVAGLALAAVFVAAQIAQTWAAWRQQAPDASVSALSSPGKLSSVLLSNGQIYYGNLAESTARYVRLENVYYVQTALDPTTNQPNNRLVNRRKADWHAPQSMSIPMDKVIMVEAVGADSRLAQLIEQDRKTPSSPPLP